MLDNLYKNAFLCYFVFLISIMLFVTACEGPSSLQKSPNIAAIYQQATLKNTLSLRIHHYSTDSTRIYIQVPDEAGLNTTELPHQFMGIFRWKKITTDKQEKTAWIADTSLLFMPVTKGKVVPILHHDIALVNHGDYVLDVELMVVASQKTYRQTTQMFKQEDSEQIFLLTDQSSNQVLMNNVVTIGQKIDVKYGGIGWEEVKVNYYPSMTQLALPPFVTDQQLRPLSAMKYETKYIDRGDFAIQKTGTYLIHYKDVSQKGLAVVAVSKDFPKITQPEDLVNALRFITKNKEFKELKKAKNIKRAIDQFWLKRAGSPDRGRILIKEFYGRVQRANQFFTTYKEGWKTDRGLIFIIYGEPNVVQKNGNKERWVYEGRREELNQVFIFKRTPNELTKNSYVLERRPEYEASWHRAVYEWRKGVIQNKSGF